MYIYMCVCVCVYMKYELTFTLILHDFRTFCIIDDLKPVEDPPPFSLRITPHHSSLNNENSRPFRVSPAETFFKTGYEEKPYFLCLKLKGKDLMWS